MPNCPFKRSRRSGRGSVAQIDSAGHTCPAMRPPIMASAIWPPPMNAIFFMIVELDTPSFPDIDANPHHCVHLPQPYHGTHSTYQLNALPNQFNCLLGIRI